MRTLYESIMDDNEAVMSHTIGSSLRIPIEQMLNSGKADKKLIKELKSKVAVYPVTNSNILDIINKYIKIVGYNCSLSWIDTSKVTNMSGLFSFNTTYEFNGDISKWNVSNVTNMYSMFNNSKFNQDISKWDVSNVVSMSNMFNYSDFNSDISDWDVSNVVNMSSMFRNSKFNQDISNWNVRKTRNYADIFKNCPIKENYKPKFL